MFAALRRGEGYQKQYIEAQDNEGNTALMLSVQKGSLAVGSLVLALSIWSSDSLHHFHELPYCSYL